MHAKFLKWILTLSICLFVTTSSAQQSSTVEMVTGIGNGDFDAGVEHIVELAKNGNGTATFIYANLFKEAGDGQAYVKYLGLAAQQSNPIAMKFLGMAHFSGAFGEPNYREARMWFEKAAGFRNVNSLVYLGIINRDGLGKSRDPKTAYFWFTLAGKIKSPKAGQKEPSDFAAEIANEVSAKDREDVLNAVAAWLEEHPPIATVSIPPIHDF